MTALSRCCKAPVKADLSDRFNFCSMCHKPCDVFCAEWMPGSEPWQPVETREQSNHQCPACAGYNTTPPRLELYSLCRDCDSGFDVWQLGLKERPCTEEKLCCLCNDILTDVEIMLFKEYCEVCFDLNCTIVPNVELHKLKRLDEKINKFTQDELMMINTMLDVYYSGLNTGLIRSKSDDSRKSYQELILKLRDIIR
jgi:hypothetical protein